jgi:Tfp pilus assembly ATPase PilU
MPWENKVTIHNVQGNISQQYVGKVPTHNVYVQGNISQQYIGKVTIHNVYVQGNISQQCAGKVTIHNVQGNILQQCAWNQRQIVYQTEEPEIPIRIFDCKNCTRFYVTSFWLNKKQEMTLKFVGNTTPLINELSCSQNNHTHQHCSVGN